MVTHCRMNLLCYYVLSYHLGRQIQKTQLFLKAVMRKTFCGLLWWTWRSSWNKEGLEERHFSAIPMVKNMVTLSAPQSDQFFLGPWSNISPSFTKICRSFGYCANTQTHTKISMYRNHNLHNNNRGIQAKPPLIYY